jgi:hypothetical protein
MPGSKGSETAKEPSEFEKKKMSIEETKRSLPVFPFKQDLIEAVREHQVEFLLLKNFIEFYIKKNVMYNTDTLRN